MLEKTDCRKLQISAAVIMGTLATSTIATGLYLISIGYISSNSFFSGFSAGILATATIASVGYVATRDCFFADKNSKNLTEMPKVEEEFLCKI